MGRFSKIETHATAEARATDTAAVPAAQSGEMPDTYEGLVRRAEERFDQGDWRQALRFYSRAVQEDSTQAAPWAGQVLALLMLSQIREAGVWAKRSLEAFPEDPATLSLQGLTFAMQGMLKRGLGTSDYALNRPAKADTLCWIARGWILLEAENKNWEFCFNKAVELAPAADWRRQMLMGLVLERYRKWPFAADHYQKAVARQTRNAFLWLRLGLCYGRMGLASQAIEAHKRAVDIDPRCREAERQIARLSGSPLPGLIARLRGLFAKKPR